MEDFEDFYSPEFQDFPGSEEDSSDERDFFGNYVSQYEDEEYMDDSQENHRRFRLEFESEQRTTLSKSQAKKRALEALRLPFVSKNISIKGTTGS